MTMSATSIARVAYEAAAARDRALRGPAVTAPAWDDVDEVTQDRWHDLVVAYLSGDVDDDEHDGMIAAIVDELDDSDPEVPDLRLDQRHPSIAGVLRWLEVNTRHEGPQYTAAVLARILALAWADLLPETAETTAALRYLLIAKDHAVRSSFDIEPTEGDGADVLDLDARRVA